VHGENQQKLDVIANDIIMGCLGSRPSIAVVASEEDDEPTLLRKGADGGKYCVVFDPLDGSSNLDVGVGVGTIFSILKNDPNDARRRRNALPARHQQVAAGTCCTDRRRCSCSPPATAWTCSCSIRQSDRSSL
jgi:fructose-1,6-bisphosphatase I